MNKRSLPFRESISNPLPNGPLIPTLSPTLSLCNFVVTFPNLRTQTSNVSFFVGEEDKDIGASPIPKTETSTNWPGL